MSQQEIKVQYRKYYVVISICFCRDIVLCYSMQQSVTTVFVSSAYLFCRDKVSFIATNLSLAL